MSVSVADIAARDLVGHYAAVRRRLMSKAPSNVVAFPRQKAIPEPILSPWGMFWRYGKGIIDLRQLQSSVPVNLVPKEPVRPPIRIRDIQRAVCEHYGVTGTDLLSARRTADVTFARQVSCYLAKTLTLKSLPEIGRKTGGRDHTTILHAVRKITIMAESNGVLAEELALLEGRLKGS